MELTGRLVQHQQCADVTPNHCGEEGVEPEGKTLNLLVRLQSYPNLW